MPSYNSQGKNVSVVVYDPQRSGTFPALLVIHGSSGPRSSFVGGYAQQLANLGYVVFFLHYFDATGTSYASYSAICSNFQTWLTNIADAVSFAERHPKVDSKRIGLLGVSLGGFLSLSLASKDSRICAVVSLMAGMPDEFISEARQMPPTLLLHGDSDPVVPVKRSAKSRCTARTAGNPTRAQDLSRTRPQLPGNGTDGCTHSNPALSQSPFDKRKRGLWAHGSAPELSVRDIFF